MEIEKICKMLKGLYLFPLSGKSPKIKEDWRTVSSIDDNQWREWAKDPAVTGFGVDLGKSNLVVIDVDTHDGTSSAFEEYRSLGLPETFTVRTPTGGKHYYFKGTTKNRNQFKKNVDVKSANGYVVSPYSNHPIAKGVYTIENNIKLSPLPQLIIEELKHTEPNGFEDRHESVVELDMPHNIQRAIQFLKETKDISIEGSGGDGVAYQISTSVRDLGVSESEAFNLMMDHWNPRCIPPWRDKELLSKVRNAYKYARNKAGCNALLKATDTFPVEEAKKLEDFFKKLSDFNSEPPTIDWIIKGWLSHSPTSITLLTAPGDTGKSLAMLQLGISISSGMPWLGLPIEKKMPVFMVCAEDAEDEIHRRLHSIRKSPEYKRANDSGFYIAAVPGTSILLATERHGLVQETPFARALVEAINDIHKGEKIVILDTLADIFSGDENARSPVSQFVKNVMAKMAIELNANIIILAHPGKVEGSTYSGSTAWHSSVRNRWYMSRPSKDLSNPARKFSQEKANYFGAGNCISLKWEAGRFIACEDGCDMEEIMQDTYDAIRSAFDARVPLTRMPQSSNSIYKTSLSDDHDKDDIDRAIRMLTKNGAIEEFMLGKKRVLRTVKKKGGFDVC